MTYDEARVHYDKWLENHINNRSGEPPGRPPRQVLTALRKGDGLKSKCSCDCCEVST